MSDRTAVVIGAGSGMGAAVARRLHADGFALVLADLKLASVEALASGLGARPAELDITDGDALRGFAESCADGIDALVITAGLSMSMASFDRIMEVNLKGSAQAVDAFLPVIRRGGAAVCMASIAGYLAAPTDPAVRAVLCDPLAGDLPARMRAVLPEEMCISGMAYGLSKFGVLQLVKRSGLAWGQCGARICSISPGLVETPMGKLEREASPAAVKAVAFGPIPRHGEPEEIANVAAFLVSPQASYITACDILVDGGWVGAIETSAPDSPLALALAASREKD